MRAAGERVGIQFCLTLDPSWGGSSHVNFNVADFLRGWELKHSNTVWYQPGGVDWARRVRPTPTWLLSAGARIGSEGDSLRFALTDIPTTAFQWERVPDKSMPGVQGGKGKQRASKSVVCKTVEAAIYHERPVPGQRGAGL